MQTHQTDHATFTFPLHTIDSAPEKSKPSLQTLQQAFGLVPNLARVMAEAPALLNTFVTAFQQFHGSSFGGAERQTLLLNNAVSNRCEWAVAFHSALALGEGVSAEDVRAIREGKPPKDAKLAALSALTRALVEKRGHVDEHDLGAFSAAGFARTQVLEVVTGVAISAMANYAGNIARPPLEEPFVGQRWTER